MPPSGALIVQVGIPIVPLTFNSAAGASALAALMPKIKEESTVMPANFFSL
jgi:hypothetical protein